MLRIRKQGLDPDVGIEFFSSLEKLEFDQEADADDLATEFLDQLNRGAGRPAGCEKIIDENDLLPRRHRITVDLHVRFPILEAVGHPGRIPGELALLSNGNESRPEAVRKRGPEDEPASIDSDDLVRFLSLQGFSKQLGGQPKQISIRKQRGDVLENDPGLREIVHVADGGFELVFLIWSHGASSTGIGTRSRKDPASIPTIHPFHPDPISHTVPIMKLEGKVALVTGGARGIGLGCAEALAREGASILLSDRPGSEELAGAAQSIQATGRECEAFEADAFSREGCEAAFGAAIERFGTVDILVSVPAYNRRADFLDYAPEDFEGILQSALLGGFHISQIVARHLVEKKKPGKIIFISSVLARIPNARCVAYSAAKAGLNSMMQTMAVELFEHHINVNAIEPGWIDTPGERQHYNDETMAAEGEKLPWGRLGLPEEIGYAAAYLASSESDYVTGTILPVDGGYRLKHCRDIPDETA